MMRDLLLEIGVEEMPSAFMDRALEDFKTLAGQKLEENRIKFKEINTMGTPRRLVLLVKDLEEKQQDAIIESRGPKRAAAFDKEGNPSKAAQGFCKGQGISVDDLEIREVSGTEYVFAVRKESGGLSEEILPRILFDIINSMSFPKSMRWGYNHTRFPRPIRWLLLLYGEKVMSMEIENVQSGKYTWGHRFLSNGPLEVNSISDYFKLLASHYVIVDQEKRKEMIWKQVQSVADEAGGRAYENEELLNEVNYLVEYPTAFYGEFSPSYLDVPVEVLTTTMIENQRYFPVFDEKGKLLSGFIGVRNGTDYCLDTVKAGNERVLKARLEDALFFWNEDTKKPLQEMVPSLETVMFHEKLGSVRKKVERLQSVAAFIGKEANLSNESLLKRAAFLCKADLTSSMVFEFTELQGIVGSYYAEKSGEEYEVVQAIKEQYMPRFAGDSLPHTQTGIALALAEKIDNLVGFFASGIKPSGSQDPYALRRQALGIVNIVIDKKIKIDISQLINKTYDEYKDVKMDLDREKTASELIDFILQRMRGILLEKGFSYDVIDAVLEIGSGDLDDILLKVQAIQRFKESSIFEDFMVVFNRANNLSKKWNRNDVDIEVLQDSSEVELYKKVNTVKGTLEKNVREKKYQEALEILADLRTELDRFFEAVMVMVEDEKIKSARLGILKNIANMCNSIAAFTKIIQ